MDEKTSISEVAKRLGVEIRTATEILRRKGVSEGRKEIDPWTAAAAIVEHYREKSERPSALAAEDKAAIIKSQRETAEREAGVARGELISKAGAVAVWTDAMLKVREFILRLPFGTKAERENAVRGIGALNVGTLDHG